MQKRLFALALCLLLLLPAFSGCGKGEAYSDARGVREEILTGLQVRSQEQVDALAQTAASPEAEASGEGVTFSLVQTVTREGTLYALARIAVDPSVPMEAETQGEGTPLPVLAWGADGAAPEPLTPVYTAYAGEDPWEIYVLCPVPEAELPAGAAVTLECVRLDPMLYDARYMEDGDVCPYQPLPELHLQLTWAPEAA